MSILFSPYTCKSITFKNRIVVSPMCQYSSEDGFATDWHLVHLGSRAVGGAAAVIAEATAVSPEGRISADDLGIWNDAHIDKLTQIASFIKAQHAVAGIQLAHAGRKASTRAPWKGGKQVPAGEAGSWQTVASSAIPFNSDDRPPAALDEAGVQKVIFDFKSAAQRAVKAGFNLIELHAAHGYLIHQFLSPLSNKRTDQYGGSFENRIRLLLEVIGSVQTLWPATLPLWVRISATDWAEGGWNIEESVKLSAVLKEKGIDLVDVSSGGLVPNVQIPLGPAYQTPFASRIRKETAMPTATVGLITGAQQAEDILQNEDADLIVMAREFLRDPYFPIHAAAQLGDDIAWPVQYLRAKKK